MVQNAIEPSTRNIHSGWLKVRTSVRKWVKLWCQVNPGILILYNSQEAQKKHRLGVIHLVLCRYIPRDSKKDGFCFKLYNPQGESIWLKKSPFTLTLSKSSIILRAADFDAGKLWLDVVEEGIKSPKSSNVPSDQYSMLGSDIQSNMSFNASIDEANFQTNRNRSYALNGKLSASTANLPSSSNNYNTTGNVHDYNETQALRSYIRTIAAKQSLLSDPKVICSLRNFSWMDFNLENVSYIPILTEELGKVGIQAEQVQGSNKNFLWHMIKRLRPGMDLSRVPLPVFILEPRSFLEKLSDYHYHCDLLNEAIAIDDPIQRLIAVVKWYLSGFYKKPKGPKKPYNPLLGETYRCFWDCPKTQSRTFFIAEQVSHHPPVSTFYVTNRKDGYSISGTLLSRSKYTGNSVSAIFDGKALLHLHKRNEYYSLSMPYANCRGILLGSLTFELGGSVEIECLKTKCKCELDFKIASMWASESAYNTVTGKILSNGEQTHSIEGHWDIKIKLNNHLNNVRSTLWEVTEDIRKSRLKCYTVRLNQQKERESIKLWEKVSEALGVGDEVAATNEKVRLEDIQRKEAKERNSPFIPQLFRLNEKTKEWLYIWADNRNWDSSKDIMQYEDDYHIKTLVIQLTQSDREQSATHLETHLLDESILQSTETINNSLVNNTSIRSNSNISDTIQQVDSAMSDEDNRLDDLNQVKKSAITKSFRTYPAIVTVIVAVSFCIIFRYVSCSFL